MIEGDKGKISVAGKGQNGKKSIIWDCTPSQFLAIVSRLKEAQAKLVNIQAFSDIRREIKLLYTFELEESICMVKTYTEKSFINSLYTLFVNADFIEREINNIFNIKFLGHPNLPRYGNIED